MQKYWGVILALIVLVSCKEDKPQKEEIAQLPIEKPIVKRFGFDFDSYTIIQDTIKDGDSFGELMLKNNVDYEKVKVYKSKRKVSYVEREIAGEIRNSLSLDMDSLGVDYNVTLNLADIYAWTIDFFRLEKGDKFKIIYDERYINDSIYAGVTSIKAAYFNHKGKPIYAFPYVTDSLKNIEDYYDQDANNLRSTFLKAPIKFNYRVSSRYNLRRRIAYYGYKVRPHKGTDYAAAIGSPIVATADGTVTESRRRGGNGKYVKIKHNGTYSTQYLHMKAQNVKKGDYVRQGNGKQVDPLREKLPSAEPIADSLRIVYIEHIEPIKRQLDCIEFTQPTVEEKEEDLITLNQQNGITQNQPYNN